MTSYQDNISFIPSSPKLPSISTGLQRANSSTSKKWQAGSQWTGPLRRKLDYSISYSGQPHAEDVDELSKELIKLMISALQPTSPKEAWLDLNHALALVQPYAMFISSASMSHYVERLYMYYTANMEKLFDVPIIESLGHVFPHDISRSRARYGSGHDVQARYIKTSLLSQSYDKSPPRQDAQSSKVNDSNLLLPDGRNPYSLLRRGEDPAKYFRSKPLTLSTINKCIGSVAMEKAAVESVGKELPSSTVAALDVDLPAMFENVLEEDESSIAESTENLQFTSRGASLVKKVEEFISVTGREAVELFLSHKHLHKVKFIYLNIAKNRHYRPYDLVSVPRDQIEKEHYIFSSFGVLHIYPDGNHSETLTLAEWNKDAVSWTAMSKIPFFKNYICQKMFSRWLAKIKWMRYLRMKSAISINLLHAVPEFGSALLHIFRLIHELSEIEFLPGKPIQICQYSITEFEADTRRLTIDAQNVLELFFRYSKKVVDTTRQACFDQLKYCEHQAKHIKPLYNKESLYIQRRKREVRLRNLEKARKVTRQLPSFVTLIDQAISVHLVALARFAITRFVSSVLCIKDLDDDGVDETTSTVTGSHLTGKGTLSSKENSVEVMGSVFAAKFVFNRETYTLEMLPSTTKFKSVMESSINKIFELMCDRAHSMHTFSSINITQRPGSAPPSVGSLESTKGVDLSDQSSVSSVMSDFDSLKSVEQEQKPDEVKPEAASKPEAEEETKDELNASGLTDPDVSAKPMPTKDEDKDGVVTPNMMLSSGHGGMLGMMVGGHGIMGHYNPLDQSRLKEKMMEDPEVASALAKQEEVVDSALKEVTNFCDDHNAWIAEIRKFTSTWNDLELEKWRGRPARKIEDQLNLIKLWSEKVKNMDRSLVTTNRLLYINGHLPYNVLVPALNSIFKKLIGLVVSEAKLMSTEVSQEVKDALKILKKKDTNMKSFAAYASKVTESVKRKDEMTEKVTYIRSLYEVVRMTYRQLTQEEEKLDEKVKTMWEAFLFQLKDATSFVTNQKPVIMKQLDEIFNGLYQQSEKLVHKACAGIIVDPKANPTEVIDLLQQFINEFQEMRSKLAELSRYHESVCGEPYNLQDLTLLQEMMTNRLELWQHIKASDQTTQDWKSTSFRKFNARNAIDKINEWKIMAISLSHTFPPEDAVLSTWIQTLDNFSKELPSLHRLSSDAMKARHWRAVFTGMGETYEAGWTFTVEELLAYKPSQHAALINQVYQSASAEYSLEQLLRAIKKKWENRQFQLAKHIYVVKVLETDESDRNTGSAKAQGSNRSKDRKLTTMSKTKMMSQEKDSDTYTLAGVEDLLKDLSESHVTLQGMLQSRHAVEVKADAEIWSDTLQQIGEIVNLWVSCQDKWMYLNRVFYGDPDLARKFPEHASHFDIVNRKYRDFIRSMLQDPKVLSVLSRRHGQRGWRDLQGETLRKHLISCIKSEEEMLHGISSLLEEFRSLFPRLYFLCDDDCVRLLGISRQPRALLPYLKKCFKGVRSVVFSLPQSLNGRLSRNNASSLDIELLSHKLEATHIVGDFKEHLPIKSLTAHNDATVWLRQIGQRINQSLSNQLKDSIENRIRKTSPSISDAWDEIYEVEALDYTMVDPTYQFKHWVLKYTCQVVLLTDAILWHRDVAMMLKRGAKKEELETLKKSTIHKFKQFSQVLQDNTPGVSKSPLRLRLQTILSSLITQTSHQREILRSFEQNSVTSVNAYEWQSLLKHSADIVDYSDTDVEKESSNIDRTFQILSQSSSVGDCYVEQLGHREAYGYEYMEINHAGKTGVCSGTVITPVTERCMLDLCVSWRLGQCAGLFGQSGVGKSVVISQLANAFGRQFINLNCSEQMTIDILKRCLCGMVETGAWLCFDQAHRLPVTTLSMLSHHIKHIQQAYMVIQHSCSTQYTVRAQDESNKLKRSNSVTTLHETFEDGTASPWRPQVSDAYLKSLERTRFEDYDARSYSRKPTLQERAFGSIVFDDKLLSVERGFGVFMNFTTNKGMYPDIPDNLRLIYRPTCVIAPDIQKLIEVWLQAAGFMDSFNLSNKLYKMYNVINANTDHISTVGTHHYIQPTFTKIAAVDIKTLQSIIMVGSGISSKLRTQQRSRAESVSELDLPCSSGTPSISSSTTSIGRSSRRSEMVLANHNEELALVDAILTVLPPKLPSVQAISKMKDNLRNIFPLASRPLLSEQDNKLPIAIQQQMLADGLQPVSEWIDKICQLHSMLKLNRAVVIAGPAGCGKTTMYRLLSKALNALSNESIDESYINDRDGGRTSTTMHSRNTNVEQQNTLQVPLLGAVHSTSSTTSLSDVFVEKDSTSHGQNLHKETYTRVDVTVLFPNAHNVLELFGFYDDKEMVWKRGLLVKLLKECTIVHKVGPKRRQLKGHLDDSLLPSAGRQKSASAAEKKIPSLCKWVVMDGEIIPTWVDSISCLLDGHRRACMSNMDELTLPKSTNIVFEASDMASASPAITSRCAIIHCNVPDNWRNVAASWMDAAYGHYAVTQRTIKVWRDMTDDLVPGMLDFLSQRDASALNYGISSAEKDQNVTCIGVSEITSLLSILSSCLTAHGMVRDLIGHQKEDDDVTFEKSRNSSLSNSHSHRTSGTFDDSQSTVTRGSSVRSRLDDAVPDSHHQMALNLFGFAFIWAFGGGLRENEMPAFDKFVRESFNKARHDAITFPPYETVYDYFVDEEFGRFALWEDKIDLRPRAVVQDVGNYTGVHQFERYVHLSSMLLSNQKSVLLVGETGCGKTSLVKNMLQSELDISKISISPGLTASHFQRLVESKASPSLKQHNLGLMAHPSAILASRSVERHHALFFLDDLACAGTTESSSNQATTVQPTLELLRQIICLNGIYEHERLLFKSLEGDIAFIGTCGIPSEPGAGLGQLRHNISPRLSRNFTVLHFLKPTKESILSVYHHSVQSWLEEFPAYSLARHYDLSHAIIAGAFDLFTTIRSHLKPSPRQPHYVFSLHDINRIMQGLFLLTPRTRGRPIPLRRRGAGNEQMKRPGGGRQLGRYRSNRGWGEMAMDGVPPMMRTVVRLWLHECSRVFHDRLIDDHDRNWLSRSLHDILKKHFCTGKDERPITPAIEKVRIVKTPIPSGGATPLPRSVTSNSESAESFHTTTQDGDTDILQSNSELDMAANITSDYTNDDGDESVSSSDSRVPIDLLTTDTQKSGTHESTSGDSTLMSYGKHSPMSSGTNLQSHASHQPTSASSSIVKEVHVAVPSRSTSAGLSSQVDRMSETTTATQAVNDDTTTTDDYESRANTAMTEDDDTHSAVTGYTTELESVFETDTSIGETMESDTSASTSTKSRSTIEGRRSRVVGFKDGTIHPSTGMSDNDDHDIGKPARPQHGGGKPSRPGGAKLGVTFMPGLIDDADVTANVSGPLIPLNQVLHYNEEATSILFSRGILATALGQGSTGDTYAESTEGQLAGALKICLDAYNRHCKSEMDHMELVFFGQAVRHAARMSRVISMKSGGHALLLASSRFTGRHSLTKLIAYLNKAQVYTLPKVDDVSQKSTGSRRSQLRKVIKEASFQSGVKSQKTILLLDGDITNDGHSMDDVCALIREGQCPALYSHKELANVAAAFVPGSSSMTPSTDGSMPGGRITSLEKLDQNLESYFSQVTLNLHVIILASYPALDGHHDLSPLHGNYCQDAYFHNNNELKSFHNFLRRCPDLLTRFSCIDLYRGWDHSSWQMVAHHFLKQDTGFGDEEFMSDNGDGVDHVDTIPWSIETSHSQQLHHVSHLMAYMHRDAADRADASLQHGSGLLINPLTLRHMVQIFVGISKSIKSKEIRIIKRYEQALRKVREAEESLQHYDNYREELLPCLDDARQTERSWKCHVEAERQEYAEARERCSIEEQNIEMLEAELEELKHVSKATFDEVHPMYTAALMAVKALSEKCLDEVKRYKHPPVSAVTVVTCLCHMFQVTPANWENGKALICQDKFFQDLEYYDKDHIPENVFLKMRKCVQSPEFKVEYVEKGSMAASKLCRWVHAIYYYAKTLRHLAPKLEAQRQAEAKLYAAQATLGSKRVRCNQIKENLDSKIQMHKNASQAVKHYEKDLKSLDGKISKAQILMENMQEHVDRWRMEKGYAKSRLESAVGDSSIVAACVAYYGSLVLEQRELALVEWIKASKNGYIDAETGLFEVYRDQGRFPTSRTSGMVSASTYSKDETDYLWNDDEEEDLSTSDSSSDVQVKELLKTRENLSPVDILSTPSEQRTWHRSNLSRDEHARCDALRLHAFALYQDISWCLMFDPDNQARTWLSTVNERLRKDMETQHQMSADPTPSFDQSRPSTTASNQADSLGIIEDEGGASSSSLSNQTNGIETESTTETEVTFTVSATAATESEKLVSRCSTQESKSRVRFADEESGVEEEEDEEKSDQDGAENEDDVEIMPEQVESQVSPPPFPLDQLWICKAIDPQLTSMLSSAITHGAFILITHLEEATSHNIQLLLKCQSVPLLKSNNIVHPHFRLFVSTSIAIQLCFDKSPGRFLPPLQQFAISDLSLTLTGLEERLEHIVLGQERSEFEAQRRLMEADIFHLEEHMVQLQDDLLLRVASIEGAILSESSLLQAIQSCKRDTLATAGSLKETKKMEINLMQRKTDLTKVSGHGCMLYNALVYTSTLNPALYHLSASQFIGLFTSCLLSRRRGKGSVSNGTVAGNGGALVKSRVVELNQSLTELFMRHAHRKMMESDTLLFTTLVTLNQLVHDGMMSKEELNDFINVSNVESLHGKHGQDLSVLIKPSWMSNPTWDAVLSLEQHRHAAYSGLARSISTKPRRWREYLNSPPVLLSKVPCNKLHSLTLGQKALLWKTIKPELLSKIADDMNGNVLGGVTSRTSTFDLENILHDLSHKRPCVFLQPPRSNDSCYLPSHHVANAAKLNGIRLEERSALFERDLSAVLEDCMIHGRWMLINDCHLATGWPEKFLQLLTTLVTIATTTKEDTIISHGEISTRSVATSTSENGASYSKTDLVMSESVETVKENLVACHPQFRLWMVTRMSDRISSTLPAMVVQHAEFIMLKIPKAHRDAVQRSHNTLSDAVNEIKPVTSPCSQNLGPSFLNRVVVPYNVKAALTSKSAMSISQRQMIVQLSLLHAVLLERISFGKSSFTESCHWTDGEMLDALKSLMSTRNLETAKNLCCTTMMRHITELMDSDIVRKISAQCFSSKSGKSLFSNIVAMVKSSSDVEHAFKLLLQKPDLRKLGLHSSASVELVTSTSLQLSDALTSSCTFKVIQSGKYSSDTNSMLVTSAREVQLKRHIENLLVQLKETGKSQLNSGILSVVIMDFYSAEVKRLNKIIDIVQSDIALCLSAFKSEVELTNDNHALLECVAHDQLATRWLQCHPDLFKFHTSQTVSQFINHLDQRVELLSKYMSAASGSFATVTSSAHDMHSQGSTFGTSSSRCSSATQTLFTYNLAAFTRPDMFLESVLFAVARARHQDALKYSFEKQFMLDSKPFNPQTQSTVAFETIYIDGLHLHKAFLDKKLGLIQETISSQPQSMPILQLTAEKKSLRARSQRQYPTTDVSMYNCPVCLSEQAVPPLCQRDDIIMYIPLSTDIPKDFCLTAGMAMTCFLVDK